MDTTRSYTPTVQLTPGGSFGRYRIVRALGQGGMGSVYLVHDTQLDRHVALKIPIFSSHEDPEILSRFEREARAAAQLQHPNLCPVYDVGEVNGTRYLTMPYIEGRPLSHFIHRDKPAPTRHVAAVVRTLAKAMGEAHRLGIIHRDLKPANIMVSDRRAYMIMDFGLARRTGAEDAQLTQRGIIMGTPAYMAPEQVSGDPDLIGPACDIYSLGVILYEMLAGRRPFEGPPTQVLALILGAEPAPPSTFRPDVDPALEAICRKAMAKNPTERFASMAEFAAALDELVRTPGSVSKPLTEKAESPGEIAAISHPVHQAAPTSAPSNSPRGRSRQALWARAGVAAAVLLALGFSLTQLIPKSPEPTSAPTMPKAEKPAPDSPAQPAASVPVRAGLKFDPEWGSYVPVPSLKYAGRRPITLEAYAIPERPHDRIGMIVADTEFGGIGLGVDQSGVPEGQVHAGGRYLQLAGAEPVLGKRVHLAFTFDRETMTLFVDGKKVASETIIAPYNPSPIALCIGASPSRDQIPGYCFKGVIEQVRISLEVIYREDFKPEDRLSPGSSSVLLYDFTLQQETPNAVDRTGHNHDGLIYNAKWVQTPQ